MLYEKSKGSISKELFKNPPCEFRGAPFWAWNGKLDEGEIVRQAGVFKEMGFGGYHIHVRTGLEDEYLGDKFMHCVKTCVDYSKKNDMLAWLYDEDRWPSGFAGGWVTKDPALRQRYLILTRRKAKDAPEYNEDGILVSGSKLLACYKIHSSAGKLCSYKRVEENDPSANAYAYMRVTEAESWHNNTAYVDTLNKKALDKFAEVTYDRYNEVLGDDLGTTCPAIFTDEPQYKEAKAANKIVAWTDDFADTYKQTYGEDILDRLPELFYELKKGYSPVRYRFWNHLSERFTNAFSDNLGEKANAVGLKMTGHMMCEDSLHNQIRYVGDVMRHYRGFGLPGIDMLCSRYEYITAKQCQSAVCQYGKEGMLSELYGVSRWDYDFRMYKLHGDWQAALGVTIRVPHLSMYSMKGEAKRDYPASILDQSPWYKKHNVVEDHFARVNTALTNGHQICDIAVLHTIESYWMLYGSAARGNAKRIKMNYLFQALPEWILKDGLDFQYINESLLPELCPQGGNPLSVGKMQYKAIVVPEALTLRKSTVERLEAFVKEGGKLIFMGKAPVYMDGEPDNRPKELFDKSICIPFEKESLLKELQSFRRVGFYTVEDGKHTDNLIYSLKEKADGQWLFICRVNKERYPDLDVVKERKIKIVVEGEWEPTLWNTVDGNVYAMDYKKEKGITTIFATVCDQDSLLIRLEKGKSKEKKLDAVLATDKVSVKDNVPFTLSEPNVMLLDRAYYALDDKPFTVTQKEILIADNFCRRRLGLTQHGGSICQPWAAEKKPAEHKIRLRFVIPSKINYAEPYLALEDADKAEILFNGTRVSEKPNGWYVDRAIQKVKLPPIKKGKNVLEISLPFGENTNTEWCYLLGDFGVSVCGTVKKIIPMPKTLSFGDIGKQGLPFYGGILTYHSSFVGNGKMAKVRVPVFRAAMVEAETDKQKGDIAYAPYETILRSENGQTKLDLHAYISRQNAFGCIHHPGMTVRGFCISPGTYRSWLPFTRTMFYKLVKEGILETPVVTLEK